MDLKDAKEGLDLTPARDMIIVKEKEVGSFGSIIIPDSAKIRELRMTEGTILVIGPAVEDHKVGEEVFYGQYAGIEVKRNGKEFRFLSEGDILGLVNGGSNGKG